MPRKLLLCLAVTAALTACKGEPQAPVAAPAPVATPVATHAFSGYREPVPDAAPLPPARIEIQHTAGRLELVARVVAAELPPPYANAALQIGLSAVIETTDTVGGNRSYWALRHVSQRPDFHQRASFVLQLGAP